MQSREVIFPGGTLKVSEVSGGGIDLGSPIALLPRGEAALAPPRAAAPQCSERQQCTVWHKMVLSFPRLPLLINRTINKNQSNNNQKIMLLNIICSISPWHVSNNTEEMPSGKSCPPRQPGQEQPAERRKAQKEQAGCPTGPGGTGGVGWSVSAPPRHPWVPAPRGPILSSSARRWLGQGRAMWLSWGRAATSKGRTQFLALELLGGRKAP